MWYIIDACKNDLKCKFLVNQSLDTKVSELILPVPNRKKKYTKARDKAGNPAQDLYRNWPVKWFDRSPDVILWVGWEESVMTMT